MSKEELKQLLDSLTIAEIESFKMSYKKRKVEQVIYKYLKRK